MFKADFLSALIVIVMLVPQGVAHAMLAGLPPVMGLYASIFPMIIYAIFGGSPTLSIGPVALISMMIYATLPPLCRVHPAILMQPVSRPNVAVLGLVEGTQHFRNVSRHDVKTSPHITNVQFAASAFRKNLFFTLSGCARAGSGSL